MEEVTLPFSRIYGYTNLYALWNPYLCTGDMKGPNTGCGRMEEVASDVYHVSWRRNRKINYTI